MRIIRNGMLTIGVLTLAAPLLAAPSDSPPPPIPPTPQLHLPPGPLPGMAAPRPPTEFRFHAPVGMQSRFTYMTINGNKDGLKLTEAQQKQVEDVWKKASSESMSRNEKMMSLRQKVDDLADKDPVDMPTLEKAIREMQSTQADDIIADVRLNQSLLSILTKEQRAQLNEMPPSFGMPGMPMPRPMPPPGMMPKPPGGPGMPGMPPAPPSPPPAP